MTKSELRKIARERLKHIENREEQTRRINRRVVDSPYLNQADMVFVYIAVGDEVDTREIIEYCWDSGRKVCIPLIKEDGTMVAVKLNSFDELKPGKYGIPTVPDGEEIHIDVPDLAVVPGLAFCKKGGRRLGQGGGYYDRYLKDSLAFRFGICFTEQLMDDIPMEEHDERMFVIFTGGEAEE